MKRITKSLLLVGVVTVNILSTSITALAGSSKVLYVITDVKETLPNNNVTGAQYSSIHYTYNKNGLLKTKTDNIRFLNSDRILDETEKYKYKGTLITRINGGYVATNYTTKYKYVYVYDNNKRIKRATYHRKESTNNVNTFSFMDFTYDSKNRIKTAGRLLYSYDKKIK